MFKCLVEGYVKKASDIDTITITSDSTKLKVRFELKFRTKLY